MRKLLLLVIPLLLVGCSNASTGKVDEYQKEIAALEETLEEYEAIIASQAENIENTQRMLDSLHQALEDQEKDGPLKGDKAKLALRGVENTVIKALAENDMETLSQNIHPILGVRMTPYSYVNVKEDLVLNQDDFLNEDVLKEVRTWGIYDGIGDPIHLDFHDYYASFIYAHDFLASEDITYNQPHTTGNSLDNHQDVYVGCISVDYHFDGFDDQYDGMDWSTLRLVFQFYDGKWYLVGIINNQWTT